MPPVARRRPSKYRQNGQALTEMAILAVVLVPLVILVSMLAKYAHVRHVSQEAARAAAWEATVTPDYNWEAWNGGRVEQQQRLIDRHFGALEDRVLTQPAAVGGDEPVGNPYMNTFSNRPLIRREDVELSPYQNTSSPGPAGSIVQNLLNAVGNLPGEFPPNSNGFVTADFVVSPQNLQVEGGSAATFLKPFDSIDLEFRGKHVLLADTWGASGSGLGNSASSGHSRSVLQQLRSPVLVPSSYLSEVGDFLEDLQPLSSVPFIGVPFRMRPGYVQPDIVPMDRLETYSGP